METVKLVTVICAILAALLGLLGNLFVVIATARYKHMRTVTNMLLGTLAVFDILLVVICNPLNITHGNELTKFVQGVTPLRDMLDWIDKCDILQSTTVFGTAGHVLCMLVITLDRLFYTASCEKYRACASKKIGCLVIVVIVILAAVYPGVTVGLSPKVKLGTPCWFSSRIKPIFNKAIWAPLLAVTMASFIAFYVMFIINCATKRPGDVIKCSTIQSIETGQIDQVGTFGSQASLTSGNTDSKSKQQLQITWAIAVCIALFIPSYLTNYIILTLKIEHQVNYETWVFHVAMWVNNVHLCINPVVYILLHSGFRNKFKRCFTCKSSPGTIQSVEISVSNNGAQ